MYSVFLALHKCYKIRKFVAFFCQLVENKKFRPSYGPFLLRFSYWVKDNTGFRLITFDFIQILQKVYIIIKYKSILILDNDCQNFD